MSDMQPSVRAFLDQFMAEVRENAHSSALRGFASVDSNIDDMTKDQRRAFNQGVNVGVLAVLEALTNNNMIVPPGEGMIFEDD